MKKRFLLRGNEEKFRSLLENMGEGVGFLNPDEIFDFANPSAEKIFGVGTGGLKGLCLHEFLLDETIDVIKKETKKRSEGKNSTYELEIFLKDGSKKDILVTATPSFENNKFTGTFGIFLDITERKQMEQALRENETKLRNAYRYARSLLEASLDPLVTINVDGQITDVNLATENATGLSRDKLVGTDFSDYFTDRDKAKSGYQKVFEQGYVIDYPLTIRHSSNKLMDVLYNASVFKDEQGKILGVFAAARDVTAFKKARETISMLAHVARSIKECVCITDMTDNIIFVNSAFLKTYQYEEHELLGRPISIVRSPNNPPALVEQIFPATLAGGWQGELLNMKKDGSEFPVYISSSSLRDENGRLLALIGVAMDITERKLAEAEINLKNQELVKLNAEKDKFFSVIAHDLRSPFLGFLGLTRMMAEDLPALGPDDIQRIAVSMSDSATKLFNLLENLLEWSHLQRGLMQFNPESFLLLKGVLPVIELVREAADIKGIKIDHDVPKDLRVMADVKMFEGVMRNLVFNAVKFTPKGGNITIAARAVPGHSVEISVRDTGIGMSPQMVDDLFRLDVQTNRLGTEGEPSSGLGLILCRDFVEKHGGQIWVKSEEGKGSVFYFNIPGIL